MSNESRTPYPSRVAAQFVVRLPDGMRDRIAEEAKAAGRSMNAEIVKRLSASNQDAGAAAEQREIAPFGLRMSLQLREAIESASAASGRSMNAEVSHRLMQTFPIDGATYPELSGYPSAALLAEISRRCP